MTDLPRVYVGIDPGARGAIVLLGEDGVVDRIHSVPMYKRTVSGKRRAALDEWELARIVDELNKSFWIVRAAIEQQQAWGGKDSPMTAASIVGNYRALRMAFIANMIPIEDVTTRAWRKAAGLAPEKDAKARKQQSMALCQDRWPHMAAAFRKDGPADAALIACWCRKHGGKCVDDLRAAATDRADRR